MIFLKKTIYLFLFFFCLHTGAAIANQPHRVLLLSSYHPGFPTFFQQVDGVKSVFTGKEILLDIEFMDTKRYPGLINRENFEKLLSYKLKKNAPYDVILVADDNAFLFALDQQDRLFKDQPIVFLGVNNVDLAIKQNSNPQITGVVEAVSMKDTIELMIKLRPESKNIIAIVDNTPSGQGDLKLFYQIEKEIRTHRFKDIALSDMTWSEFYGQLQGLSTEDAVLLLSAYKDKNNTTFLFNESLNKIKKNLSIPLFHLWYHGIGDGILGGKVINHFEQGRTAAEIVLQITGGKPVKEIKVSEQSPNQYVFDYNELQKHNLFKSVLPKKSLILNTPYSFYNEYKIEIWLMLCVVITLTTALFIAIITIVQKKQVETKHKEMIANISDVIAILDSQGIIRYKSTNIEKLFGWAPNELIGKDGLTTAHPDDIERIKTEFRELIGKNRSSKNVEYRYLCKDGSYKWIDLKAVNLTSVPAINGILLNYCDVTERKIAEKNLVAERDKLEIVTQSVGVGLAVISKEYKTIWANKIIYNIFGDVNGKLCHVIYNQNKDVCENCGVKEVFTKGKEFVSTEQKGKDANGNTIWSQIIATPIRDEDGNITSALEVVLPITERKLLEDQLRQSQKMESIGTLTGGVAHDFNNILGIIIGNTELALEDLPEWNPVYKNLEEIKTAAVRASGIVKNLLSFSRKTDYKLVPVEIIQSIKEALSLIKATIPSTIEIQVNLPHSEQAILADPVQMNQVIMNLCINASQAMEATGGTLSVAAKYIKIDNETALTNPDLKVGGSYLKLSIVDSGPGIDPKIVDKIFDPYFTTKAIGKGSGLGLSIVHGIVTNHNGAITVKSEPGGGAAFTILLPLADEIKKIDTEKTDSSPSGSETILFVDDEESIVKMTKQMLIRMGYQVHAETNPIEALSLFEVNPAQFDLVITDMTMPQMTGVQLSEKLFAIRKDIPVIICTGHSLQIDEEKANRLGINAFIMKPIIKTELAKTIHRVLHEKPVVPDSC